MRRLIFGLGSAQMLVTCAVLAAYLMLEKARFGDRLDVSVRVAPEIMPVTEAYRRALAGQHRPDDPERLEPRLKLEFPSEQMPSRTSLPVRSNDDPFMILFSLRDLPVPLPDSR